MQQLHTIPQATAWLQQQVTGTLWCDSRKLQAGDGFVAWPGAASDGRKFVNTALQAGAAACLVEHDGVDAFGFDDPRIASFAGLKSATGILAARYFNEPSRELAVMAVTGTNGKTSTAWWLAQALSALPAALCHPCGMVGTLGVGRPPALGRGAQDGATEPALVATGLTTPDPVLLQQTLRRFVDDGLQACVMEASSIGIEEGRLDGTDIRVAIFTNFTQDHLDYHGDMEAYWAAKRRLFSWSGLQSVVINIDDARGAELAAALKATSLDVWTVSAQRSARLGARQVRYDSTGVCFDVCEGGDALPLRTHLIGSYNVANLLGVIAAMRCMGVPLKDAVQVCAALRAVPGRMEVVPGDAHAPLVAVDYAHTPDALDHALAALRPLATQRKGRLWCVFGCGGDRDAGKRPLMGAIAARLADRVVVTSDNPRSEKPEAIIAQILLGISDRDNVHVQSDRTTAIADTIAEAGPADVILLAGKGHENTQEVAGVKHAFLDHDHAARALRQRAIPAKGGTP